MSTSDWWDDHKHVKLMSVAKALYPMGNGDEPEATKTGLARAYELMRKEATTIILLYATSPPHTSVSRRLADKGSNLGLERTALGQKDSYGGFGPLFVDWVSAARTLTYGEKKGQVFSFTPSSHACLGHYHYLSTVSRGACFYLQDFKPASISKVTVEILLGWMGVEKAGTEATADFPAFMTWYTETKDIEKIRSENDSITADFFFTRKPKNKFSWQRLPPEVNLTKVALTPEVLKRHLTKKAAPIQDAAKRYAVGEDGYKRIVTHGLREIIQDDVTVLSLNPVSTSRPSFPSGKYEFF